MNVLWLFEIKIAVISQYVKKTLDNVEKTFNLKDKNSLAWQLEDFMPLTLFHMAYFPT